MKSLRLSVIIVIIVSLTVLVTCDSYNDYPHGDENNMMSIDEFRHFLKHSTSPIYQKMYLDKDIRRDLENEDVISLSKDIDKHIASNYHFGGYVKRVKP